MDSGETGTRALTYDSRGNVKSIGNINMNYDATDRPTGLSGDTTGSYRYDGHGRRVKSITVHDDSSKTTRYNVYDASGALVYVVQVDHSPANDDYVMNYVQMDGRTISRVKSNGTRLNYEDEMTYLHHDHLGSAVAGTDENGAVLWTEKYTPFGISLVNDAANDNQAGFTGHLKDTDTGLTYMQARYYDPVIGRFLSHDPEGFMSQDLNPMYFNRFKYAINNPINAVDPYGEKAWLVSRPLQKEGFFSDFDHMFVVVQDDITGEATRFSYGPQGDPVLNPGKLVSHNSDTSTTGKTDHEYMVAFLEDTSNPDKAGVSAVEIDAPDSTVLAVGNLLNEVVGTSNSPGEFAPDYFATPSNSTDELGATSNSNAAASFIGGVSKKLSRNLFASQPIPTGSNPPGFDVMEAITNSVAQHIEKNSGK